MLRAPLRSPFVPLATVATLVLAFATAACGEGSEFDAAAEDAGPAEADAAPATAGRALAPDELLAGTACPVPRLPGRQRLTFHLLSRASGEGIVALGPQDHAPDDPAPYGDLLGLGSVRFALPPGVRGAPAVDEAGVEGMLEIEHPRGFTDAVPGRPVPARLTPVDVGYLPAGAPAPADAPLHVILLLDHSGSLRGQPDPVLAPNPARASDLRSLHLEFFARLLRTNRLPQDTVFSLVWFHDREVFVTPEFATPTTDRTVFVCPENAPTCIADPTRDGLAKLAVGQAGGTPLTDALDTVYLGLVGDARTAGRRPVVVLFTDGVENGDTSVVPERWPLVVGQYAQAQVPLMVVHLEPTAPSADPRGPKLEFAALACATGGEYLYVARPDDFAEPTLRSRLVAALFGAWAIEFDLETTPPLRPGAALLTTAMTVTLGASTLTASLVPPAIPGAPDTRVFLGLSP